MTSVPTESSTSAKRDATKRDTTAVALLAAVLIAAGLTGVATLSAAGSGALQEVLRFAGVGRATVLEQEQQRQAATLAEIERILNNVQVDLGSVEARAKIAQADAADLGTRLTRIDGDIGSLRESLGKRPIANAQGLRDAMHQSDKVVHGALMEVASLRSTFDANETTNRKEFAAINQRLDRLERTLTGHDITSSVQKRPARKLHARRPAPAIRANNEYMGAPVLRGVEMGAIRRAAEERQAGAW